LKFNYWGFSVLFGNKLNLCVCPTFRYGFLLSSFSSLLAIVLHLCDIITLPKNGSPVFSAGLHYGNCQLVCAGGRFVSAGVSPEHPRNLFRSPTVHQFGDGFEISVTASEECDVCDHIVLVNVKFNHLRAGIHCPVCIMHNHIPFLFIPDRHYRPLLSVSPFFPIMTICRAECKHNEMPLSRQR